ncbi:hypothetical protein N9J26_00630 [bacterium]|nr:hypothetical protein [bacterium]
MKTILSSFLLALLLVTTHSLALEKSSNAIGIATLTKNANPLATIDLLKSTIIYDGQAITRKIGSSGKPKYINSSGHVIAKINLYDGKKIKIKDNNGNLLWKIKIKESRVKIANNDSMDNAYKLEQAIPKTTKIYSQEQLIGETKKSGNKYITIIGQDKYTVESATNVQAGIIALDDIPMVMRFIIISELSKK